MVAQSEVEKLREELNRVRAEGGGNLFGKNILLRLVGWLAVVPVVQLGECWCVTHRVAKSCSTGGPGIQLFCDPGEGHRGTQELILSLKKSLEAEQLRSMTLTQVGHDSCFQVITFKIRSWR